VLVFVIGAGMTAVAGVMYAHYISFIDPTSFTVMESIFIISIVIIGGAGSMWGPVLGAVVLVVLPELLRFVGLPSAVAANVRQIIYGGLLVAMMMWRPQGRVSTESRHWPGSPVRFGKERSLGLSALTEPAKPLSSMSSAGSSRPKVETSYFEVEAW